jgi:hypothetical protein
MVDKLYIMLCFGVCNRFLFIFPPLSIVFVLLFLCTGLQDIFIVLVDEEEMFAKRITARAVIGIFLLSKSDF